VSPPHDNFERRFVAMDTVVDAEVAFEQFCNAGVAKLLFTDRRWIPERRCR
jgi:hypothetical protein